MLPTSQCLEIVRDVRVLLWMVCFADISCCKITTMTRLSNAQRWAIFVTVTLVLVIIYLIIPLDNFNQSKYLIKGSWYNGNFKEEHKGDALPTRSVAENPTSTKIILYWTKYYTRDNGFAFGFGSKIFQSCRVSNCFATNDRNRFNESHAVLFHNHAEDFFPDDIPKYRFVHQRFIMYYFEPVMFSNRQTFESAPEHFFNWTFSWRRFSDIASSQYGEYRLKPSSFQRKISADEYELEESLDNYYGINITAKSIMAAWFSSHCDTGVKREDFVSELKKYIRVDVYGKCGNLTCPNEAVKSHRDCEDMLGRDYLFYLSFENSLCPDYVTEKLYRPLVVGAVPVVFGAAHYSRYAPPHSYINALEFPSPKDLADYLIVLSENRKMYAHYFEWRRHFEAVQQSTSDWCELCEKLNDNSSPPKTYKNIAHWWFDYFPCLDYQWKLNDSAARNLSV